jgi:hypothetical protein
MFKLLAKKSVRRLAALILLDIVLFSSFSASEAPSFMVIVAFVLLVLTIYYAFYNLISLSSLYGVKVKHRHQMALYMTAVAGILVALQSTGELGTRDFWVLLPLVILGYFYSTYARSNSL